jgi:hypothetical protein
MKSAILEILGFETLGLLVLLCLCDDPYEKDVYRGLLLAYGTAFFSAALVFQLD